MLVHVPLYFYKYSSPVLVTPLLISTILAYCQGSSLGPLIESNLDILSLSSSP